MPFLRKIGTSAAYSLLELILFAPVILLIGTGLPTSWQAPLSAPWNAFWLTALGFTAGSLIGDVPRLRRKVYELLLSALVGTAATFLFVNAGWQVTLGAILGAFFVYRGIRSVRMGRLAGYPPVVFGLLTAVYFIGVPIMTHTELLHGYAAVLNGCGLGALFIFFVLSNRSQLLGATLAGTEEAAASSLSRTVRQSSRVWLIVFLVVLTGIAYFQQVGRFLLHVLRSALVWLIRLMNGKPSEAPTEPAATPPPPQLPPSDPSKKPAWLEALLHYAMIAFIALVVLALAAGLIYLLVAKVWPAVRRLLRYLLRGSQGREDSEASAGYTDEREDLLNWKELPSLWWQRMAGMFGRSSEAQEPGWSQLRSNRERVRFLYRKLIERAARDGYAYKQAYTPSETEQELSQNYRLGSAALHDVTVAYNRSRYGDEELSTEEVERLVQQLDPKIRNSFKT